MDQLIYLALLIVISVFALNRFKKSRNAEEASDQEQGE